MRVAILCEFSGVVRDAFIARGHDAISCDLLPTEKPGPHIQGDCLAHDWRGFDLLIAHPPCKRLAVSGARWFAMYRQEQDAVMQMIRAAKVDWSEMTARIEPRGEWPLVAMARAMAVECTIMAAYVEARRKDGRNHADAVLAANKAMEKVRNALGYTHPDKLWF